MIAPGIDWPVAIAARIAAASGFRTRSTRRRPRSPSRSSASASGSPRRAFRSRATRRAARSTRRRRPPTSSGYPCVVKAPDRQGQRGLSLVAEPADLAGAVEAALARVAEPLVPRRGARPRAGGDGQRVLGRRPLHPAHGHRPAHRRAAGLRRRARARLARRAARGEAARGGRGGPRRRSGSRDGPTYTQIVLGPDGPARRRARRPARRRPRRRALPRSARASTSTASRSPRRSARRPEVPRAARRAAAPASAFSSPRRASSSGSRGSTRRSQVDGVRRRAGLPAARAGCSGRSCAAPTAPGFVLAVGDSRDDALARADRAAERVRFVTAGASPTLRSPAERA